jgi:hypothetical protein
MRTAFERLLFASLDVDERHTLERIQAMLELVARDPAWLGELLTPAVDLDMDRWGGLLISYLSTSRDIDQFLEHLGSGATGGQR